MGRLKGKVALITGAGAGLGRAIAICFAREGAHVFVTDRDGESAETVAREIADAGGNSSALTADITDLADVKTMFEAVERAFGRLDILVNNAGISRRGDFKDLSDEDWSEVLDVNLQGVVRCTREALGLLKASGKASVVNLASIMERRHIRQISPYSTTKAAVAALSRSLAVECAPMGIRVNYLCPGYVETALTARFLRNPVIREGLIAKTPLRRLAEPEEVAMAALFLASDESSYVTGEGLTVDGGMSIAL
jgi:NAD(P)-dependent dehydrogenase (short-subunit alcohol dehydrogenase family)